MNKTLSLDEQTEALSKYMDESETTEKIIADLNRDHYHLVKFEQDDFELDAPSVRIIRDWDLFELICSRYGWAPVHDSSYLDGDIVYVDGYGAVGGIVRKVW